MSSIDGHENTKNNITGIRDELNRLERRFSSFNQQQFSFIHALVHCRQIAFEPNREISTISLVSHYAEHVSDSATGKRILGMFLNLVKDLNEFRRKLVKLTIQPDERLDKIFARWKKTLEPTQNISQLRAKFPNSQLNHLSVTESKFHFGGIVSVLPIAMDCARDAVNRVESTRAYRRPISARGCAGGSANSFYGNSPFAPGGFTMRNKKASLIISSPVPSRTITHGTVTSTRVSSGKNYASQKFKPARSMSANPDYNRQALAHQHPTAATQTPRFLGSTVKPNLKWKHQGLSEEQIRKSLKNRPSTAGHARPNWKP